MTDVPTSDQSSGDTDTDNIRRGGLRRLRAGLPLEVSASENTAPVEVVPAAARSLPQFTAEVERAIAAATESEQTALLVRADHRPIPAGPNNHALDRWQLHATLEERLLALHPDLMVLALSDRQILLFAPNLRRRDDGEQLLAQILDSLSNDITVDGLPHVLEPRVGGALLDRENPDAGGLFEAAEIALSETDATHHHVLFHPYQRVRVSRQEELDVALRVAILEHGLSVALQPAVDLTTGKIVAIEAFARWTRPDKGPVATADLIHTAGSLGVLNRVGEQILQKALFHVSDWVDADLLDDVTLWLNMTATDVLDRHLVRTILDGTRLNDRVKVGIELSPSSSPDAQAVISTLRALSSRGARAAIGDLGVGFASFSEAQHLPFDSVKLDRTLMTQITANHTAAEVVRHLIALSQTIGLESTAQGIETAEQLEMVREMGCRFAQGYVFTKPLPPEEFKTLIQNWDPSRYATPTKTV